PRRARSAGRDDQTRAARAARRRRQRTAPARRGSAAPRRSAPLPREGLVSRITRRLEKLTRDLVGGRSKEIGALAREIAAMTDGHLLDETARVTDDIRWRGQGPERYAELMALNEHGKRAPSRGVGFIGEMSDDELRDRKSV